MSLRSDFFRNILRWFDTEQRIELSQDQSNSSTFRFNPVRLLPYIAMHVACIGVFFTGVSATAIWVLVITYLVRMFAITGFYHRYFAHRTFHTNRFWQFFFAFVGASSAQRGPLWWAGHHRHHHQHSDTQQDIHSPSQHGFWWSHLGWFSCDQSFATPTHRIKDFDKFKELRWLNRFDMVAPATLATGLFILGNYLEKYHPSLETSGGQLLFWGFFVSTVLLFHATCLVNSLGHVWGSRRYDTKDNSRNNGLIAFLTLGEGWHNNHHRFPATARQGFYWWEIDITFYLLKAMSWVGMIHGLKPVPKKLITKND